MATKTRKQPKGVEVKTIPLSWPGIEDSPVHAVTNIISQFEGDLFVLTFGFTNPPVLLGTPAEIQKKVESIHSVKVSTVGRIALTEAQLEKTIDALQLSLKRYRALEKEKEKAKS